ncbi:MAG: ABC transporter substrate-binding protein [Lentisphaerae bacterium]|nr:ABC transporter substrate-binding protein [Lentisphaerota bacterium]
MKRSIFAQAGLLRALVTVLMLPFLLKPRDAAERVDARALVILSPHNETVRHEFDLAFRRWHLQHYAEAVTIDWRNLGGTSEIILYLDSEYEAAQRAGLAGIGIDLFFGGGQYDHARQAARGQTVPCGLQKRHPEWLRDEILPLSFAGAELYDAQDRWYGCCLSSFGICYNEDVLRACGIERPPQRWKDLTDFRYFRQIALADPTKSGSINKAFEILIQEEMLAALAAAQQTPTSATPEILASGWREALNTIRQIGANARYFTDAAGKVPMDVAQGDAAAGMCIDYYGRVESESVWRNERSARMRYITPPSSAFLSVDPISLLRGAPQRDLAERFIDFCLSQEGQKLWNYRVGERGGPQRQALRRLPVRRDMYSSEHLPFMADAEVMPYQTTWIADPAPGIPTAAPAAAFAYQPALTEPLFGLIRVLIRALCLDTQTELTAAWQAIHRAGGPQACPEAMAALMALPSDAEYEKAQQATRLRITNKLEEARAAREWVIFFRNQYRQALLLAQQAQRRSSCSGGTVEATRKLIGRKI